MEQQDRSAASGTTRFGYNGKLKDNDVKGEGNSYDYGDRFYDPRVGRFLSMDPFSSKFPSWSSFSSFGDNPIKNIEIDGKYFVDANGNKIDVTIIDGKFELGKNSTPDLREITNYINESKSKTAAEEFEKLANNDTKIHFNMIKEPVENKPVKLAGLHRPHDANGKMLDWDSQKGGFNGEPEYIRDMDCNITGYKEATISIFKGNITDKVAVAKSIYFKIDLLVKTDVMVGTFTHEGDHDTNIDAIKAIKDKKPGYDVYKVVEKPALEKQKKVHEEIKENRNEEKK